MPELENNEDIYNQLESEQDFNLASQQFEQVLTEGGEYGRPSYLKFGFLFLVAGIVDLVDLLDLTGVGIIVAKIVSIGGTGIIYLTMWLTNGKVKKAQNYGTQLQTSLTAFQSQLDRADRLAQRASKIISKLPGLKGIGRGMAGAPAKVSDFIKKSPLNKVVIGGAINLVPFLAVVNLMLFWVYMSYRDEKQAYQQARETAEETVQQFEQTQTA